MATISVLGLGLVGLTTAIAFSLEGHQVTGIDVNRRIIGKISHGETPFFEPGLSGTLRRARERNLVVTQRGEQALAQADVVFLCVGTPANPDGSMNATFLHTATGTVAKAMSDGKAPLVIMRSTVVPGTTEDQIKPILEQSGKAFNLAVNPEFLRAGHAIADATSPDRLILGIDGQETGERLRNLYSHLDCPIAVTDLRTAEAIKYATNAFLASKVAFANELANICGALGVSYDEVISGVALDPRINARFLVPGVGFGGSCFEKDLLCLMSAARGQGYEPALFKTILHQNDVQYLQAVRLLEEELRDLGGKRIAILGLSFKGETGDVRGSRAVPLARTLLEKGAIVIGYDPVANDSFHTMNKDVTLAESLEEALTDADGCIVQADWPEFSKLDSRVFSSMMRRPVVVDGRRVLDPKRMNRVRFRRIG